MGFTHYPKQVWNLFGAVRWPAPPDKPTFLDVMPLFSTINHGKSSIGAGEKVVFFHEAQNFTRFAGTLFADQSFEFAIHFSNDIVTDDGDFVTDENISKLHYDGEALRHLYDPKKHSGTCKYFVSTYGRWLRVEVKNVGDKAIEQIRVYVNGSVF